MAYTILEKKIRQVRLTDLFCAAAESAENAVHSFDLKDKTVTAVDGACEFNDIAGGLASAFAGKNETGCIALDIEEIAFFFAGCGDGELGVGRCQICVAMLVQVIINGCDAGAFLCDLGKELMWMAAGSSSRMRRRLIL